jgi:hypothetical protein
MVVLRAIGLFFVGAVVACNGAIASGGAGTGDGRQGLDGDHVDGVGASEVPKTPASATFLGIGYPPDAIANDADYVYWSELNTVYRASKTRPTREKLFGDGTSPTSAIVVDDAYVYAVDRMRGSVWAWAKSGERLELVLPESVGAMSLAQDAANLYVGTLGGSGIVVVSKATRTSSTLRAGKRIGKLAVTGSTIYSAELENGNTTIVRSTTGDSEISEILSRPSSPPVDLVAVAGDAFWTDSRGLMSSRSEVPIYPSPPGGLLAGGLTVDERDAYVTEIAEPGASEGRLLRVSIASTSAGASTLVAILSIDAPATSYRAYGLRQTRDHENFYLSVYWSSDTGGGRGDAIVKVPVPASTF